MATPRLLLYGATGFTGSMIARELVRRGMPAVLAGRSVEKLAPLAKELDLPWKAVSLGDAAELVRALEGIELVLHAAGPFERTSRPMVDACLAAGASYADITGELDVLEAIYARDEEARARGVALVPAIGFDVIPTDCLAVHVAGKLPGATQLEIAIAAIDQPSAGTAKSAIGVVAGGGRVRRGGRLAPWALGRGAKRIRFPDRERDVMPAPLADLASAWRSTLVPDITTYVTVPRGVRSLLAATWPIDAVAGPLLRGVLDLSPVRRTAERLVEGRMHGPGEAELATGRSYAWARASRPDGASAQAWLVSTEGYAFTAVASVRAAEVLLEKKPKGALAPAEVLGPDFVLGLPGTERLDALP